MLHLPRMLLFCASRIRKQHAILYSYIRVRISDSNGKMEFKLIAEGTPSRSMLDTNDAFLLDADNQGNDMSRMVMAHNSPNLLTITHDLWGSSAHDGYSVGLDRKTSQRGRTSFCNAFCRGRLWKEAPPMSWANISFKTH